MRSLISRIIKGKPTEEAALINQANAFPRYTPTTVNFRHYTLQVTDMLSVAWQIHEFFADERMKFFATNDQPLIVDCGANVGVSLIYYKALYPQARVIAFEPDPAVFKCLEQNVQQNDLQRIDLHQKAVWVNADGVSFGSDGADGGSIHNAKGRAKVPTIRLRDLLLQHERIDLLKVDIEGAETKVLLDCDDALQRIRYLYVEYHSFSDQDQELHTLLAVLAKNGFRYYMERVGPKHQHPFAGMKPAEMDMQLDIHAIRQ
ncbi:MAG TPA: FkbM family methyltransferase [Flavobacteriales bacterium]|nr:FkbM family methyltransferase [Flavobacteriales bacterium]